MTVKIKYNWLLVTNPKILLSYLKYYVKPICFKNYLRKKECPTDQNLLLSSPVTWTVASVRWAPDIRFFAVRKLSRFSFKWLMTYVKWVRMSIFFLSGGFLACLSAWVSFRGTSIRKQWVSLIDFGFPSLQFLSPAVSPVMVVSHLRNHSQWQCATVSATAERALPCLLPRPLPESGCLPRTAHPHGYWLWPALMKRFNTLWLLFLLQSW